MCVYIYKFLYSTRSTVNIHLNHLLTTIAPIVNHQFYIPQSHILYVLPICALCRTRFKIENDLCSCFTKIIITCCRNHIKADQFIRIQNKFIRPIIAFTLISNNYNFSSKKYIRYTN